MSEFPRLITVAMFSLCLTGSASLPPLKLCHVLISIIFVSQHLYALPLRYESLSLSLLEAWI